MRSGPPEIPAKTVAPVEEDRYNTHDVSVSVEPFDAGDSSEIGPSNQAAMTVLFILFLGVILASGLCSMVEAALLSLSVVRARVLLEQGRRSAKDVVYLKDHIQPTIATIVILNNAINIIGSIYIGQIVSRRFGNEWLGAASALLTFTIIIMAEIIPKTVGEQHKVAISLIAARPLRFVVWLLHPLVSLMVRLARPFLRGQTLPKVTEDEIRMMLRLGRDAGTVELDEETLCNRVFKLNDLKALQIMKPIEQIFSLPAEKSLGELRETIIDSPYSRIAVYDQDPRDFVGIVRHRVLLREIARDNDQARVRDFMHPPIFVNWFTKADELLEKFQAYHQHLFIVQDAEGRDVGLVTMEDVLEELFGEIYDEKDVRPRRAQKV